MRVTMITMYAYSEELPNGCEGYSAPNKTEFGSEPTAARSLSVDYIDTSDEQVKSPIHHGNRPVPRTVPIHHCNRPAPSDNTARTPPP